MALPKDRLLGDWESAGNDIIPVAPYEPTYEYRYDCQIEIEGESNWDSRVFAVAGFTVDSQSPRVFKSENLEWRSLKLDENGEVSCVQLPPETLADSPTEVGIYFDLTRGFNSIDNVFLSLQLKMGIGSRLDAHYWLNSWETSTVTRTDERVQVRAYTSIEAARPLYTDLYRTAQVICDKIK